MPYGDLGQHLTRNTCHLSCWINLIYHLNDLPAQFGRVTSNVNHFSFHNIRMIGMPFQTRLLDLKYQNDRVTCFGNRIVMTCCSFQPGSGQYMPNTSKYPNHSSIQISTGKPLTLHLRCCCPTNAATSGWSSVERPRPEPGRRHMTWERRMKHTAHIIPQTWKILTICFLIYKFRFHAGKPTLPVQLTGQSLILIFEDLEQVKSY